MLTVLTILSAASVATVYAVLIGAFTGGDVTIGGGATGAVTYSSNAGEAGPWTTSLTPTSADASWYSKLNVNGGQYSGTAVTISWQLQRKTTDTTWSNVGSATNTDMTLIAGAQDVYATPTGVSTDNHDWGVDVAEQGTYRVVATVNSK
jgi:hypothetical protein